MIELSHVSRTFGTFRAVDDISFSIPSGQIVGLLGPNGAGKTTTMRMISGFLAPSSGTISIDGVDVVDAPIDAKRKIGYMPESAPLYSDMIVEDYLRYVAAMQSVDATTKVPTLAGVCGLTEVMHKNISELSRGYKQRVGLAHALMQDPEILILDEPTSGLDPNQIIEVRNLIKKIGLTRTVIVSTHILGEVEMICDRVIIISRGKIVADSLTDELRGYFGNQMTLRLTVGGCTRDEVISALASVQGVSTVKDASPIHIRGETHPVSLMVSVDVQEEPRPALFRLMVDRGWTLYELAVQTSSLEDVFRALTADAARNVNESMEASR
jgi:ABC-2 type transport system ATP-binding protein